MLRGIEELKILEELDRDEKEALAKVCTAITAHKGDHVILAEEDGQCLLFILNGKLNVSLTSEDGKEIVVAQLNSGEFFGEISVLTGKKRTADVISIGESRLLKLNKADFFNHTSKYTGLTLVLLKQMAVRLSQSTTKISELALLDVSNRLYRTLKSMAEVDESEVSLTVVKERPTHQELSALIGTSREMVSRAIKSLEKDEFIKVEGKRVFIL